MKCNSYWIILQSKNDVKMPQGLLLKIYNFWNYLPLLKLFGFLLFVSSLMRNHIHSWRFVYIWRYRFGEWQINVNLPNPVTNEISQFYKSNSLCMCVYMCGCVGMCIYSHIIFIKIFRLRVAIFWKGFIKWLLLKLICSH